MAFRPLITSQEARAGSTEPDQQQPNEAHVTRTEHEAFQVLKAAPFANPKGETHRSECGEDDAGEEEDETAAAADTTATALPAAAAAAAEDEDDEEEEEEEEDAAAARSDRMWIHDEDGGDDAAVGEDDDDGEDEVLDRRSAFMSLSATYPEIKPPAHPTAAARTLRR